MLCCILCITITAKKNIESTRACAVHLNDNIETLSKAMQLMFLETKPFETCTHALTQGPRGLLLRDSQRVSSLQTSPPAMAAAISVLFNPRHHLKETEKENSKA